MKTIIAASTFLLAMTGAALADGDAEAGQKAFTLCKACHSVIAPSGDVLVKGGKVGPNLYGIIGRQVATVEDFKLYGEAILAVGATGLVWTEDELEDYMTDPNTWIKDKTGNPDSKSKMTGKTAKNQENIVAYLLSLGS